MGKGLWSLVLHCFQEEKWHAMYALGIKAWSLRPTINAVGSDRLWVQSLRTDRYCKASLTQIHQLCMSVMKSKGIRGKKPHLWRYRMSSSNWSLYFSQSSCGASGTVNTRRVTKRWRNCPAIAVCAAWDKARSASSSFASRPLASHAALYVSQITGSPASLGQVL